MACTGKKIRWSRFLNSTSGKSIIVPLDHGLTMGPLDGLNNIQYISKWIEHPAISGVIAHKGMIERLGECGVLKGKAIMIHLNGMTDLSGSASKKSLITSVEAAVRLGADAVSVELHFNKENDAHNLMLLGRVVDEASLWGLPVLTMVKDLNVYDSDVKRIKGFRQIIRTVYELGADAIKVPQPENIADISDMLENLSEDIDVFIAGGPKNSSESLIAVTTHAISCGATGLCIGRNVFQRNDFDSFLNILHKTVHAPLQNSVIYSHSL